MFLMVPAHPGSPGQRVGKRLSKCLGSVLSSDANTGRPQTWKTHGFL